MDLGLRGRQRLQMQPRSRAGKRSWAGYGGRLASTQTTATSGRNSEMEKKGVRSAYTLRRQSCQTVRSVQSTRLSALSGHVAPQ